MLQEEQIRKLTQLKELLDAGILTEDEFAKEKAKVLGKVEQVPSPAAVNPPQPKPQPQPQPQVVKSQEVRTTAIPTMEDTAVGPAYVGLSQSLVLPLGILAILFSILDSAFSYMPVASLFGILSLACEAVLWVCAFNKLATVPRGKKLGNIPLMIYLYLGSAALLNLLSALPIYQTNIPHVLALVAALVCGYIANVRLYKTYSRKMRVFNLVWMIGMAISFIGGEFDMGFIGDVANIAIYVFFMIALLEKEEKQI